MLLPKNNFIVLLCIKAFVICEVRFPAENLRSTQSATCARHHSYLAHDGKTTTFACSVSDPIYSLGGAWWEGDLGSVHRVSSLTVLAPNKKSYSLILKNFGIYICNDTLSEIDSILNCNLCASDPKNSDYHKSGLTFQCTDKIDGQFVVLFKHTERNTNDKRIVLSEIKIFVD